MAPNDPISAVVRSSNPIRCHRDLLAWQRAMDLAEACYRLAARLPGEERFGLSSQLRRAAVSVAANIAEGHARNRTGACLWSLSIARGSLMEVDTLLRMTGRLGLVDQAAIDAVLDTAAEVGRLLAGLQRALRRRLPHPAP